MRGCVGVCVGSSDVERESNRETNVSLNISVATAAGQGRGSPSFNNPRRAGAREQVRARLPALIEILRCHGDSSPTYACARWGKEK